MEKLAAGSLSGNLVEGGSVFGGTVAEVYEEMFLRSVK